MTTNDEFRIATLGPEPKPIKKETGFDSTGGDGYDYMDLSAKVWTSLSAWGLDGWDLGDWPYVIVQIRKNEHGTASVRTRVEGDLDTKTYATYDEAVAAIDHIAWWYWLNRPSRYGGEMTQENLAADPARYRGRFSWTRLNEHNAQQQQEA